jgi:hypothetical protein
MPDQGAAENVATGGLSETILNSGQNDFVSLFKSDNGLFPVGGLASLSGALAAILAANIQRIHSGDFDFEKFLNGLADLGLVRTGIGHDRILVVFFALARAFFSKANSPDNFESFHGAWESVIGDW